MVVMVWVEQVCGSGTGQGTGHGTGQGTGYGTGQGTGQGVGQGTGAGTGQNVGAGDGWCVGGICTVGCTVVPNSPLGAAEEGGGVEKEDEGSLLAGEDSSEGMKVVSGTGLILGSSVGRSDSSEKLAGATERGLLEGDALVGSALGIRVGWMEVGDKVGLMLGVAEGLTVGMLVGLDVGTVVGECVGARDGLIDGDTVGKVDVGLNDGDKVGSTLAFVGYIDGLPGYQRGPTPAFPPLSSCASTKNWMYDKTIASNAIILHAINEIFGVA